MNHRLVRGAALLGAIGAMASFAPSARAEDLFEVQVFHARVVPRGHVDVELHTNYAAVGPRRIARGEVSSNGTLYELLEPSYGIAPGWEIAAHVQQAFRPDGTLLWGGEKLRVMKLFNPEDEGGEWHFALNAEGGYQPERFDPARWGVEVRPILEWTPGVVDIDLNPIVAVPLAGEDAGIPQLMPAISLRLALGAIVQPSIEYYAELGPLTHMTRADIQRHYVYETLDVVRWRAWILHAGIGQGLTRSSTTFVATTILGHIF